MFSANYAMFSLHNKLLSHKMFCCNKSLTYKCVWKEDGTWFYSIFLLLFLSWIWCILSHASTRTRTGASIRMLLKKKTWKIINNSSSEALKLTAQPCLTPQTRSINLQQPWSWPLHVSIIKPGRSVLAEACRNTQPREKNISRGLLAPRELLHLSAGR